jgi:hypothetical protein
VQVVLFDKGVGPDLLEQLILRQKEAGSAHERDEELEGLGL